jgi:hypothetical protein
MVFWRRSWISEAVAFRFDDEVALRFVAEPTPPFGVLARDDIAKPFGVLEVGRESRILAGPSLLGFINTDGILS